MSKYNELVTKLREIFQINRPELDFGIYRILNARAKEINEYLDKRLKEKVQAALDSGSTAGRQQIEHELREAEKQAAALAVPAEQSPKVRELRERLATLSTGSHEHENAVFSHLLTFFSRYYDNGDFISQRRYKGDTYAIPYAGEEVMLHWANKDQYYTKSGENFSNYSFKLDDGRTVHFRLVAADTAKDNRKDNDKERRFALIERSVVIKQDDEGDDYEEELLPVEVQGQELLLRFAYQPMPKGPKQDALTSSAVSRILADATVQADWTALATRAPTEKDPQRTLLEKHLTTYTTRNTADYFIHKDLGGFLRRELDFYIKSDVMNLDDVQHAEQFAHIEKSLRMIQCLRAIALDLIDFLAQLENFQKKLWLKKKFVVSADYCITLDRVPEALYPEIAANEKQWAQWHALGLRDSAELGTVAELKQQPAYMVDTSLFGAALKQQLLQSISAQHEAMDGLIVNSDNFQGLNTISASEANNIDCIYIDPPYNTSASEISYKNNYKHSSWMSMLFDRVEKGRTLLNEKGNICITIDDAELTNLSLLMDSIFGSANFEGIVPIRINPSGRPTEKGFALTHEYAIFYGHSQSSGISKIPRTDEQIKRFKELDDIGRFEWRNLRREGSNSDRADGARQYYPIYADLDSGKVRVPLMHWNEPDRSWTALESSKNNEVTVYPVNDAGIEKNWRWSEENVRSDYSNFIARTPANGTPQIYYKYRENEDGTTPLTLWTDKKYSATEYGTKWLKDLFGNSPFSYPKSVHAVHECLSVMGMKSTGSMKVIDYFAGSGTTAHAVISKNREGAAHKYILIEQGEYFEAVTKPRVQKVVYSADWKNGKPTAPETGISHCFKVLKLESYEDTLNNLALRRNPEQSELLATMSPEAREDYLLHYMLDVESRGSLLSVEDFRKPFDYTLKIAVDSAGACEPRKIDLVETFNYLIGLTVQHIDMQLERGFVSVTGTLPSGETALILWRDCDKLQYTELADVCDKLAINPNDSEFDVVYLNGDHNIPAVSTANAEDGGATRVLKLRQIEPEFLTRMFDVEDV